jgi:hypothetical protein
MTLGRRKAAEILPPPESDELSGTSGGATDLLKRFDIDNK